MKVTLAGAAAPTFRIDGQLVVRDGAKLVVDADGFTGGGTWTKIVDVRGGRTGSFDPANITLTGKGVAIVQNRTGDASGTIWLKKIRGIAVSIR